MKYQKDIHIPRASGKKDLGIDSESRAGENTKEVGKEIESQESQQALVWVVAIVQHWIAKDIRNA